MEEERFNVLVLNIHGGFPSCMIKQAFRQLPNLASLAQKSDFYNRAYPTNVCAASSLHDIIMDAPLGSMIDTVWHDWCYVRHPSRTLFHIFQQNGYGTNLFGAFGLDKKLDPHANMHNYPGNTNKSLQMYGIDEFETQDAAFTCQMAFAHDKDVLRRAASFLESVDGLNFTMINLLGCQDVHKCSFESVEEESVSVPLIHFDELEQCFDPKNLDARQLPKSVDDNPRNTTETNQALHRTTMLYDWLRGNACQNKTKPESMKIANGLRRFSWKCLVELDKNIGIVLEALKTNKKQTIIYITSDHALSLFEHGVICESPWDSCLRSFLLIHHPDQVTTREVETPYTLASLSSKIMNDCNLYADWHVSGIAESTALTIGVSPSWLCRAFLEPKINVFTFRTFFLRMILCRHGRLYSIITWFSIQDLLSASNIETATMTDMEKSLLCKTRREWQNPILNDFSERLFDIQVFDLSTDPTEMHNIANETWLNGKAANAMKKEFDSAMVNSGYEVLLIAFPDNVHEMTPDRITFCSVQLHHRIRERACNNVCKCKHMQSVTTQTTGTQTHTTSKTETSSNTNASTASEMAFKMETHAEKTPGETVNRFRKHNWNPNFVNYLSQHITRISTTSIPLTIFVPENLDEIWPTWLPAPVCGIYTKEAFHAMYEHGIVDVQNTTHHVLLKNDVTILSSSKGQCTIQTVVSFSKTCIVYKVQHLAETSTEKLKVSHLQQRKSFARSESQKGKAKHAELDRLVKEAHR